MLNKYIVKAKIIVVNKQDLTFIIELNDILK